MEKLGKPVPESIKELESLVNETVGMDLSQIDFQDSKVAFAGKTDEELKKAAWLFGLMNKYWLVGIGSKLGLAAIKMHLPFVESIVKNTIFQQFCGGTTLLETKQTIARLQKYGSNTILDFGAEGKETETDFNHTMSETIRALEFAARHESVPVVSSKITGMARFGLLEKISKGEELNDNENAEYSNILKRLDSVCHVAKEKNVSIYFDAEESWIQNALDQLVNMMMKRYNTESAIVFNTFQMYRHDRLAYLKESFGFAEKEGYFFGAKLVRGAYMEKERDRAEDMGYPSPIHVDKAHTDHDYNAAITFCVDHFDKIALSNATHNAESCMLMARLIEARKIPRNHPHMLFCQLFGMSDNITFNLAKAGFNVAKYVPYGPVREVVPYLIRRAQENSSVTGDMSRELSLVIKELKRRGLN
ncbi:MAG: proline dehydrogenase family protein [Saprospiraceae bacterium]|nr:proline dehydrogenase family protein [Saprospiraceae bacterium]